MALPPLPHESLAGDQWDTIRRDGGHVSFADDKESDGAAQENDSDFFLMPTPVGQGMSDLYGLKFEPMPNRLVNYGVTENGIAVIELTSDSAGAPLEGPNDRSPNTYTHGMMRDIDEAIVRAFGLTTVNSVCHCP